MKTADTPAPARCDVWLVHASRVSEPALAAYCGWLSNAEMQRFRKFIRPERQRQFVLGRVLLRHALAGMLGVTPRAVQLRERPGDAPALEWPEAAGIGLSLSHSGPWVACAVSPDAALGLDIEVIDPKRDVMALAEHVFDSTAVAALAAATPATQLRDFYELWCLHEARIKLRCETGYDYLMRHRLLGAALCSDRPLAAAPELKEIALPVPAGGRDDG